MRAYKFLKSEDVFHVKDEQTIRLPSAREIRSFESGVAGFGDSWEMQTLWSAGDGVVRAGPGHPPHPLEIRMGKRLFPNNVTIASSKASLFAIKTDGLIFSAAKDRSPAMVRRMRDEFGYDASFEIPNFRALAIAAAKASGEDFMACDEVSYAKLDPFTIRTLFRSPFQKLVKFDWQREVRFVLSGGVETRIIAIPRLSKHMTNLLHH